MTAPLSELSFALGETNFTISKLLAEEAFDTFEIVRVGLADVNRIPLSEDAHAVQAVTAVFSGFSRETFRTVRDRLFAEVQFTRPNIKTARKVHGNISTAFDGLEPFHIYEVFARAFVVNFRKSWDAALSMLGVSTGDLVKEFLRGTSNLSSPSSSPPD